jgi:hypothetical protein
MKTTTSKPRRRRRAAIALFAATAALAGGAQALAPSPAAALDGTGICMHGIFIYVGEPCEDKGQDPGTGGGGGDATPAPTTTGGDEAGTSDDPNGGDSTSPSVDTDAANAQRAAYEVYFAKKVKEYEMGKGTGMPWWIPDELWVEARRHRFEWEDCTALRGRIQNQIASIYDLDSDDVDIDFIANSDDDKLNNLQGRFSDWKCGNVLAGHFPPPRRRKRR